MRWLIVLALRLLLFYGLLLLIVGCLAFYYAAGLKRIDPEGWSKGVNEIVGLTSSVQKISAEESTEPELSLTDAEKEKLKTVGKDPELVLRALRTEAWAVQKFGADSADAGIYIALTSGESANCTNAGKGLALTEMRKRGFTTQMAAFNELLEIWQRNKIRGNLQSHAKDYLPEDYNPEGVKGSVGAGALGCSQFMAGTAKLHLAEIGEPFDLWDPETAMKVMAAEVARLGYKKSSSPAAKIQVMLGWNQDKTWITGIVGSAVSLAESLKNVRDLGDTQTALKSATPRVAKIKGERLEWQKELLTVLTFVGLGPSEVRAAETKPTNLAKSADESWQLPVESPVFTSDCQAHRQRGSACGWDLAAAKGSAVYPTRDGTVVEAACGWNGGYGCEVLIDHGGGFKSRYGHLIEGSIVVKVGDKVTQSTVLGKEGSTGNSTGPHVHFEIIKDGAAIDPLQIFGSFTEAVTRQKKENRESRIEK